LRRFEERFRGVLSKGPSVKRGPKSAPTKTLDICNKGPRTATITICYRLRELAMLQVARFIKFYI
jgi:hypothetical protein